MSLVRFHIALAGLRDGALPWLDKELLDYDAPFDLPPQGVSGARAADSPHVAHTSDRLPTTYAYTLTGHLHARTPEELQTLYFRLKRLLRHADQAWRGDRFLKTTYALIGGTEALRGQCVVPAPIVCAVRDLRWYDKHGRPLE